MSWSEPPNADTIRFGTTTSPGVPKNGTSSRLWLPGIAPPLEKWGIDPSGICGMLKPRWDRRTLAPPISGLMTECTTNQTGSPNTFLIPSQIVLIPDTVVLNKPLNPSRAVDAVLFRVDHAEDARLFRSFHRLFQIPLMEVQTPVNRFLYAVKMAPSWVWIQFHAAYARFLISVHRLFQMLLTAVHNPVNEVLYAVKMVVSRFWIQVTASENSFLMSVHRLPTTVFRVVHNQVNSLISRFNQSRTRVFTQVIATWKIFSRSAHNFVNSTFRSVHSFVNSLTASSSHTLIRFFTQVTPAVKTLRTSFHTVVSSALIVPQCWKISRGIAMNGATAANAAGPHVFSNPQIFAQIPVISDHNTDKE